MRPGADITIESIRPGDEEQRHHLGRQAFGATTAFDPEGPVLEPRQVVCAYDGGRMVGAVVVLDFAMTWGGRPVPCGGVSGVVVAPEARGLGLARRMLAEALDRMAARGQHVSALYPTTTSLYRGVGFEAVGWFARRRVPLGEIPAAPADDVEWRRVRFDDPAIRAIDVRMAADLDGWFRPDRAWAALVARRWEQDSGVNRYAYVGRRGDDDVSAVVHHYVSSETTLYDLEADVVVGVDAAAVAASLGLLASHGTTAGWLRTTLPGTVLARHVPQLQRARVVDDWPLMLRLVDPAGAVEARGWPAGVTGRVELDLVDDARPAGSGRLVLEIEGGEAALVPGGSGRVGMTVQDLAAVYAGADVRAMRAGGRLAGATPGDGDLLAAACVASPTIPYFF